MPINRFHLSVKLRGGVESYVDRIKYFRVGETDMMAFQESNASFEVKTSRSLYELRRTLKRLKFRRDTEVRERH